MTHGSKNSIGSRQFRRKQKKLQQQRESIDRYSGIKEKIRDNPHFQNAKIIPPQDGIKMSEILLDFIQPYINSAPNRQAIGALVDMAVVAWNTAVIGENMQGEAFDNIFATLKPEYAEAVKPLVRELIQRKLQYFAEYKRMIIEYNITGTADDFHLSVVSSPEAPDPKQESESEYE